MVHIGSIDEKSPFVIKDTHPVVLEETLTDNAQRRTPAHSDRSHE